MTPPRRKDPPIDELPELPALVGDDEPIGDAAGDVALTDDPGSLDDASADIAIDHAFDETDGVGDDDERPLDVGAAHDGIDLAESGGLDDRPLEADELDAVTELPALSAEGDRGEEGPLEELLAPEALPPMDDDDDDDRAVGAAVRVIAVDAVDVTDLAVDGATLWLLTAVVARVDLDRTPLTPSERFDPPEALCVALGVDRRGAPAVVSLDGAVWTLGGSGRWSLAAPPTVGAMTLLREGPRLLARSRSGALLAIGDAAARQAPSLRRVTAWASDPGGGLVVHDGSARDALLRREDGGAWDVIPLPEGCAATRIAVRGGVLAVVDAPRGSAWLRVEERAAWTLLPASRCLDVAVVEADDGRLTLWMACVEGDSSVALLRGGCEPGAPAPARVASLRRAVEEAEGAEVSVRLIGVGRAGVHCVARVDGRVYVITAG